MESLGFVKLSVKGEPFCVAHTRTGMQFLSFTICGLTAGKYQNVVIVA